MLTTEQLITMATKDIVVNGQVFPCPLSWTVKQALESIRSENVIQGGGIRNDGVPVLGTARIRDLAGPLSFVGGQPIQQLGMHQIKSLFFLSYYFYLSYPLLSL